MTDLYELRQIQTFGVFNAKALATGDQVIILTFDEPDWASTSEDPIRWVMSRKVCETLVSQLQAAVFDAELFDLNGGVL